MKEKIGTALSAFGMSGRVFHAPLLAAHPGFELLAVIERHSNEAEKQFPQIRTFRSLEEVLRDPAIDLLVVNVPDHLHFPFCKAALEAGKQVVVEKPFTLTTREGETLIKIAEQVHCGLFVFQNRRWDSDFLTVQEIIHSGRLGQIVEYEAHYDRFRPEPPGNTWKEDGSLGTGLLFNLGSHLIDQALVLFGWPEAVFADLRTIRPGTRIVDYFHLILKYPGLRAHLKSSYVVKEAPAKFVIHGLKGSFIKSGMDPQEERLHSGWKADAPGIGTEVSEHSGQLFLSEGPDRGLKTRSLDGSYLQFYEGVYQELTGNRGSAVSARAGLDVVAIIEAALKSQTLKKWIPLIKR